MKQMALVEHEGKERWYQPGTEGVVSVLFDRAGVRVTFDDATWVWFPNQRVVQVRQI